ncbi:serine/threonine protein kinase [Legionella massiliensis]|uniref:Serine/threonine protein kinase n=1 Tax=Legionella massiliensis TaxID=1034943 RepID=A0A078KVN6_9GAMM|nr:phosphotransferase [Legionella massiliensis]CDZ75783.1 serine/threonine protein kinase [Legionella massiliensis]CEE11521.1 3-deoxy-D-manno-octulosonic acid kinase [Legionella massiliensis]
MLKSSIEDQHIIELLQTHYGVEVHTVQLMSEGADTEALAYKADSQTNSYFVKLKYGYYNEINLSLVHHLYHSGIKEIILPIPTVENKFMQQLEHSKIIVYPFIHALNGFTKELTKEQWLNLGRTVKKIHEASVPDLIQQQLRKEMYSAQWRDLVRSLYSRMEPDISDNKITADFKLYFKEKIDQIHQLVDSAEELSKKIHFDPQLNVLCHTDIHAGNILVDDNDSIHIIDWDEPMLAPKERDLMFIGGGVGNVWNRSHEVSWFYEGYGNLSINKTILSYYRHERIVEDVAIYGQDILAEKQTEQSRLEMLHHFKGMFAVNGVVEIAFASE